LACGNKHKINDKLKRRFVLRDRTTSTCELGKDWPTDMSRSQTSSIKFDHKLPARTIEVQTLQGKLLDIRFVQFGGLVQNEKIKRFYLTGCGLKPILSLIVYNESSVRLKYLFLDSQKATNLPPLTKRFNRYLTGFRQSLYFCVALSVETSYSSFEKGD